jgi:hypothetical protein
MSHAQREVGAACALLLLLSAEAVTIASIATPSEFLLRLEQLSRGRKPLFSRNDLTIFGSAGGFHFRHNVLLFFCGWYVAYIFSVSVFQHFSLDSQLTRHSPAKP